MPRARTGSARHRRKVRTLREARGFRGARSKQYRTAKHAVVRAGVYAYRDRRNRKRDFRALWVTRISAACRMRGFAYSHLIYGLNESRIILNRKMLSELAIHDPAAFDTVSELARKHRPNAAA